MGFIRLQYYCLMIKKYSRRDHSFQNKSHPLRGLIKSEPFSEHIQGVEPSNLHALSAFPMRYGYKSQGQSNRQEAALTYKQQSIEQIKSKLKEYLRNSNESSLLNYQNDSLPEFTRRSIHEHFRTTLFRNSLKKKANLKIIENSMADKYESPEFNVSEACINPRSNKRMDASDRLFHPKREYFIQNHNKKEKTFIYRPIPPRTVYPLTNRESSYIERERGGLGVQPWRRWGRESEQGEMSPSGDP